MKLEIATRPYNERRYGKPWVANVDFTSDGQGEFRWGNWCGDIGGEGILFIEANPGDIVATGQKDFRKPRNSAPEWFAVKEDGSLEPVPGRAEAFRRWREVRATKSPAAA
jgi:hypothetical protein